MTALGCGTARCTRIVRRCDLISTLIAAADVAPDQGREQGQAPLCDPADPSPVATCPPKKDEQPR